MESTQLVTGKINLIDIHIFEINQKKGKYSIGIVIPKSDIKSIKLIIKEIISAINEGRRTVFKGKIPDELFLPIVESDIYPNCDKYNNCYLIEACSFSPPDVVDKDFNQIVDPSELNENCFGCVSLSFYPFVENGFFRIGAALRSVRKL